MGHRPIASLSRHAQAARTASFMLPGAVASEDDLPGEPEVQQFKIKLQVS
ncbi:MAG: hypothetical protein OXN21_03320 [Chloroflexota bacterium]|nr:hypothetical protein [Chloroflexota bacterium]